MRTKQYKIFFLDDDEKMTSMIKKVLEAAGYLFKSFDSTETISSTLKKELPDLLIVDPVFANNSGLEFLKTRQEVTLLSKIPVLALSKKLSRDNVNQLMSMGVEEYQIKPINSRLLLGLVRKHIELDTVRKFHFDDVEDAVAISQMNFTKVSETNIVAEMPVKLTDDEDGQYRVVCRELEDQGVIPDSLSLTQNTTFVSGDGMFRANFRWRGLTESMLQKIRAGKF
ncbi:MAG: hypothetical protein CME71_05245 [Halobacteriovorax sp.]|nr:hypothetical protein [Halobacteriovorax sp.]